MPTRRPGLSLRPASNRTARIERNEFVFTDSGETIPARSRDTRVYSRAVMGQFLRIR